jgi:nucleoid-associated protein YgaU
MSGSPVVLGGGVHVVHPGETLTAIARQAYGDPRLWPLIEQANHLANPNLVVPGQALDVPAIAVPELGPG